jgi:protein-S-isoprenylcysteine O-methyltransferase Ste14
MNYLALGAGTAIILLFSWFFSVKHKRYHGIPRFFAFESIYILLLLNFKNWFRDPWSLPQITSWILLIICLYPAISGFFALKRKGKPAGEFENTTVLVKTGVYRFIRHPLYLSLFLLGTGIMMKDPGPLQLILGAINLTALFSTAKTEEKEMLSRFGKEYREYMKETKMFIPFFA